MPSKKQSESSPNMFKLVEERAQGSEGAHGAGRSAALPPTEIAAAYEQVTKRINPLIARAEKVLTQLRLGVSASVPIECDESGWEFHLRFAKVDKEWCLLLDHGPEGLEGELWTSTRLQSASREMRLKALTHLPALQRKLVAQAESELAAATGTLGEVESFVSGLEARIK